MKKKSGLKRHFNPLAAALIIVAASSLVIGYCIMRPQYATATLIIYLCTIVCATLILALSTYIYKSKRTSIDEKDITNLTTLFNVSTFLSSLRITFSQSH